MSSQDRNREICSAWQLDNFQERLDEGWVDSITIIIHIRKPRTVPS